MLEKGSAPLARTTCCLLSEAGPVVGELVLEAEELGFVPEPGAEEHGARLPLSSILAAAVTPIQRRLLVQTATRAWWFDGPGLPTLGARLEAALHKNKAGSSGDDAAAGLAEDEPLLSSGPARWRGLPGELWLTDRRLRFVLSPAWRWLAGRLGLPGRLEVPRGRVRPLPAEGAVVLLDGGARLSGPGAWQAALLLGSQAPPALLWPLSWRQGGGWLRGGWIWQRGLVALEGERLRLLPANPGQRPWDIPLAALGRLAERSGRLHVQLAGPGAAEAGGLELRVALPRLLLRRLVAAALQRPGPREARAVRAVRWHDDGSAELGRLALAERRLRFEPAEPGQPALEARLADLRRVASPAHAIRLEHAGQVLRFEPSGGGDAVEEFWRTHDIPERTVPWPADAAERRRLLDDPRCVTITFPEGGEEIMLRPGFLLDHREGLGVFLPATVPLPAAGTVLTVEIGRADGIYQLDGRFVHSEALPEMRFPRSGQVFVLAAPAEVRFFNQRAAFRVAFQMPVSAWKLRLDPRRSTWVPDGDRITGQLIDLSISGCALHTRTELRHGEHLFLELLIDEHWLPLEAECVRTEPGWPEGTNVGLRFLNLPERLEQLLSRTVLAQQRAAIPPGKQTV